MVERRKPVCIISVNLERCIQIHGEKHRNYNRDMKIANSLKM
jgi:hypothetical protein